MNFINKKLYMNNTVENVGIKYKINYYTLLVRKTFSKLYWISYRIRIYSSLKFILLMNLRFMIFGVDIFTLINVKM